MEFRISVLGRFTGWEFGGLLELDCACVLVGNSFTDFWFSNLVVVN